MKPEIWLTKQEAADLIGKMRGGSYSVVSVNQAAARGELGTVKYVEDKRGNRRPHYEKGVVMRYAKTRRKPGAPGTPVTINGVTYPSKRAARSAMVEVKKSTKQGS